MNELEIDPLVVYQELRERRQRGGQPHPEAAATRRMLSDMRHFEARIDEIPAEDHETARALMWGWTASRAVGEVEERLIALEQRNSDEDRRRAIEDLQYRSAGGGTTRRF
ncbi:hypothetical protein [Mycobacterium spongiae]|uniref:Uncharacterized protein n=1 Tax=Mycobacterium spongiae TaxID=886343 RepID=A0A975JWR8_9MYCO|nr:hypothetical protein [Mycobacterium spongiae]QUR67116.1 hypothetical protein F6B93_08390 [Mycobacterium spongiae]